MNFKTKTIQECIQEEADDLFLNDSDVIEAQRMWRQELYSDQELLDILKIARRRADEIAHEKCTTPDRGEWDEGSADHDRREGSGAA